MYRAYSDYNTRTITQYRLEKITSNNNHFTTTYTNAIMRKKCKAITVGGRYVRYITNADSVVNITQCLSIIGFSSSRVNPANSKRTAS